jgi:hypothetical protein
MLVTKHIRKKCVFSVSFKEQFPLIKESSDGGDCKKVRCSFCRTVLNVRHEEKSYI